MGAHPVFSISRRFSIVRARLLLLRQAKVVALEEELEKLDFQEPSPLNLGSFRADTNIARIQVLKDLDKALAEYGKYSTEALHSTPPKVDRYAAANKIWGREKLRQNLDMFHR